MMLPTHALVGLAVGTPLVVYAPQVATAGLAGGLFGGVFPDLDMYTGHRRLLHYPSLYPIAAVPAVLGAVRWQTPLLVGVACGLLGATLHCQMDRYGGGLELKPWEGTSDRAVYDHVRGRWRAPKRWVRYDGAPEDLLVSWLLGIPLWLLLEQPFQWVVVATLMIGTIYVVLRSWLAELVPIIVAKLPASVLPYVPERYRQ